jgi:probable metal-binding protein
MSTSNAGAPPTRIHGHEVMAMMVEAGRPFTRTELAAAIVARFGPGARFHTCSAGGMTAEELVAFLEARGKFTERGGRVSTTADRICSHEGEDGSA